MGADIDAPGGGMFMRLERPHWARVFAALRLLLSAIVLCAMRSALHAQERVVANEGPSLDETLGWVGSHLTESGYYIDDGKYTDYRKPVQMSFAGCAWTFDSRSELRNKETGKTWPVGMQGTISARDLAVAESKRMDTNSRIGIVVLKSQFTDRPALSGRLQTVDGMSASSGALWIYFEDASMADRMATAFSRAITLCGGGKKELF
jgi:hypothetical protein